MRGFHPPISSAWRASTSTQRTEVSSHSLAQAPLPEFANHEAHCGTCFSLFVTLGLLSKSPLVDFRIVFLTGAAYDPPEKLGVANLTAAQIAGGGTRELTYKQFVDAMFPMATYVASQVDKEMITFYGSTDVHNLETYYRLLRGILLNPGWREADLRRVKDRQINFLRVSLRES